MNGRRHLAGFIAPLGDSTVDVNSMIPALMIDRMEIVKDGSSALYGSDAVAGVVNFITKKNFEGVDVDVRFLTDEATQTGDEKSIGLLIGSHGERGGFVVGADWLDRAEISTRNDEVYDIQGGFGISTTGQPGRFPLAQGQSTVLTWADGSGVVPRVTGRAAAGQTPRTEVILPRRPGANPADLTQWGPADLNCEDAARFDGQGGTLGSFPRVDSTGANRGIPQFEHENCVYDFGNFFSIQEAEAMQKFYASGYFNLTDNIELYVEGGYSEQEFYRLNSLAPQARAQTIPITHPGLIEDARRRGINPVPLVNGSRLVGGTPDTPFHIRPITSDQDGDRDTLRFVLGIDADFVIREHEWNLNASFTSSELSSYQENVEDGRAQELAFALNGLGGPNCNPLTGTPGEGNIAYAVNRNFDDGRCYYYNPFGNALFNADGSFRDPVSAGNGLSNPPQLLQWLEGAWIENDEVQQRVIDIIAAGTVYELPSGPVGLAFGYQRRGDSIVKDFDVNFRQANAAFRFQAFPVNADLLTQAVFVETSVPLLSSLELSVAVRAEEFDEIDTRSVDPKVSLIYRPSQEWTLRGSWGTSFRVGGLMQLFGTQTIVSNTTDPLLNTQFFLPWISTGNPTLEPEESEAWNIGVSWRPEGMLEGLSFNADFWNYDYTDRISKESAPALLVADANSRRAGGPGLPNQVIRNSTLNPIRILPNFINASSVVVNGVDFDVTYDWEIANLGQFNVGVRTAWVREFEVQVTPGGPKRDAVGSTNTLVGTVARALPEFKINGEVSWALGRHSVFAMARYTDSVDDDRTQSELARLTVARATGRNAINTEIGAKVITDLYYNYELPSYGEMESLGTISLGVRNAFDIQPEVVNNQAGFDGILHDARGRMWMLRWRSKLM